MEFFCEIFGKFKIGRINVFTNVYTFKKGIADKREKNAMIKMQIAKVAPCRTRQGTTF